MCKPYIHIDVLDSPTFLTYADDINNLIKQVYTDKERPVDVSKQFFNIHSESSCV